MKLRKLQIRDAEHMLEWMHDAELCADLHANFASKTLNDCIDFIEAAQNDRNFVHLAIVNDNDEYMGTVSLKNISYDELVAEFGIVVRRCAMGYGYSYYGMNEILKYGFREIGLKYIYWCVSKHNVRACKFYNKHNFKLKDVNLIPISITEKYNEVPNLIWYEVAA